MKLMSLRNVRENAVGQSGSRHGRGRSHWRGSGCICGGSQRTLRSTLTGGRRFVIHLGIIIGRVVVTSRGIVGGRTN
jgi:hypothetical protein